MLYKTNGYAIFTFCCSLISVSQLRLTISLIPDCLFNFVTTFFSFIPSSVSFKETLALHKIFKHLRRYTSKYVCMIHKVLNQILFLNLFSLSHVTVRSWNFFYLFIFYGKKVPTEQKNNQKT